MQNDKHHHDHDEGLERERAMLEGEGSLSMERRAFLRLVGFSLGAVGIAGCSRGPAQQALTLLHPDPHVVAGRPYWIATSSWTDGSGSGILAKCVDGRPIKLEGNPEHPVNRGGLTAACQASLLSLYDDHRFDGPTTGGAKSSWAAVDAAMKEKIAALRRDGGRVRLLTSTITSPSTLAWISKFLAQFPDAAHVMADALSCSALLDACADLYGIRALPRFDLARAKVLASFDADFLGTWISPAGFTADWAAARSFDGSEKRICKHWQFESRMSLTGARADRRVMLAPWEISRALVFVGSQIAAKSGKTLSGGGPNASQLPETTRAALAELAEQLWDARGAALVLCGQNDRDAQTLALWINEMLGARGTTMDLAGASLQRRGDDAALEKLRDELLEGKVDLLIVSGCNPAYELPGFAAALKSAKTLVSMSALPDETSMLASFNCPEPHELERWDDAEPFVGVFTTTQPTIPPLRATRTLRASLAAWIGESTDERALLVEHWKKEIATRRNADSESFDTWFSRVLERGWIALPSSHSYAASPLREDTVARALQGAGNSAATQGNKLGLVLYAKISILDGRGAHNPWLQELPDPVSKIVWDNHADIAPSLAKKLGLKTGDLVRLHAQDGTTLELPALVQPGQDPRVVAVALGYGRMGTDRFTNVGPEWIEAKPTVAPGSKVGVNAAPLLKLERGQLAFDTQAVSLEATGAHRELACTQDYHSLSVPAHLAPKNGEVRDAVRVVAFAELGTKSEHGTGHGSATAAAAGHGKAPDLWPPDHENAGPQWGMVVDLANCTGCSACVIGCQAENNVPVVGRDEVARHREMSWLRIDRYYDEREDGSVEVTQQPMMCHHCGNAPCETVCPVLATMHSSEGLNQQVYNRCVGTRYCANNCPYKVRRFNWFEYAKEDQLQNMALNPEVTIRSKGVMEKCSLCVQRIQAGKAAAKRRGEPVRDGEIQTACQQSCPSKAITFGNLKDPHSEVGRKLASARAYEVLGELNVKASVRYLADVRDAKRQGGKRHG